MPPEDPRSDLDLIAAMNRGDSAAFAALYARHREWVYRIALRFAANPDDAAEATQEVFLAFLRKFPGFRLTSRLTTYLYPIAKNTALARRRHESMRLRHDRALAATEESQTTPSSIAPHSPALRAALARLPDMHREILSMRAADDMTLEEIATALSIPLGTVKSRLHNALQALRNDPGAASYFDR